MDWGALQRYLGIADDHGLSEDEWEFIAECWEAANTLVHRYLGATVVPVEVLDHAILDAGAALYRRKNAPGGATNFTQLNTGEAVRISSDPLAGARSILAPWVGLVIA